MLIERKKHYHPEVFLYLMMFFENLKPSLNRSRFSSVETDATVTNKLPSPTPKIIIIIIKVPYTC